MSYMICKYFFPFHRLPFYFVDCFFAAQKLFSLMEFHLFIFAFVACALGVSSKTLPRPVLRSFFFRFSFRSFMISNFKLQSLFQINFCEWCKLRVQFHFFAYEYLVFLIPFIEEIVFSPLNILDSFPNISLWYMHGFISGLLVLFC